MRSTQLVNWALYRTLWLVCAFAPSITMAAPGDFALAGVPTSAENGTEFVATFTLDTGTQVLGNYKVDIAFDPAVLNIKSIQGGTSSGFTGAPIVDSLTPLPSGDGGRVNFGNSNQSGSQTEPSGVVTVATITFTVVGDALATSSIGISPERIRDIDFPSQPIATNAFQSLSFSVSEPVADLCNLIVADGSTSVPATGGTTEAFSVDVSEESCAWTVTSSLGTASVDGDTGDGGFTVTIPENTGTTARTISVTVTPDGNAEASVTTTITQDAPLPDDCTLTVTGGSENVPAAGGTTAEFSVDATEESCAWTVTTSLGTTSVPGGTGNGVFTVTLPENTGTVTRNVTVVVTPDGNAEASVTTTITQDAPVPDDCTLTVTDGSDSVPAEGGTTAEFSVNASDEDCAWTVTTSLGTTSVPGGTGNGSFTVTIPANAGGASRNINVTVTPSGNVSGAETVSISQQDIVIVGDPDITFTYPNNDGNEYQVYLPDTSGILTLAIENTSGEAIDWQISQSNACRFTDIAPTRGTTESDNVSTVTLNYSANSSDCHSACDLWINVVAADGEIDHKFDVFPDLGGTPQFSVDATGAVGENIIVDAVGAGEIDFTVTNTGTGGLIYSVYDCGSGEFYADDDCLGWVSPGDSQVVTWSYSEESLSDGFPCFFEFYFDTVGTWLNYAVARECLVTEQCLLEGLDYIDIDGDTDTLTYEESLYIVLNLTETEFAELDVDGDGKLSRTELSLEPGEGEGEGEGECEILDWYGGSYSVSSSAFSEELWVDMSSEECGWEFSSNTPGVEFSPASGNGDATVSVSVPENFGEERVIEIYVESIENETSNFFSNYIQDGVGGEGEGEGEGEGKIPTSCHAGSGVSNALGSDLALVALLVFAMIVSGRRGAVSSRS